MKDFYISHQLNWFNQKLHTSLKTGSVRKNSISFRFVAASRKKSFHASIMSHNAEVKLQS